MNTFEGHKTADRGAVSSSRAADKPQIVRLAVVVVTYQTRELLREFLLSLRSEIESLTGVAVNVVVVDNASTDGTVEMVRTEFPEVRVVANAANFGPARAFNQGLAEVLSDADVVLLANSDIYIHAGTLKRMIEFLGSHPRWMDAAGDFITRTVPQFTRTRIVSLWPVSKDKPHRATFPGTGFSMIRASAFARIGGFDETYYFYNEDLDWAERARRAGLAV
jgi:Predicted glycosyltransferases